MFPVRTDTSPPYPVRCTIEGMRVKIPAGVRAAITEISRQFGALGGKASAPEEAAIGAGRENVQGKTVTQSDHRFARRAQ